MGKGAGKGGAARAARWMAVMAFSFALLSPSFVAAEMGSWSKLRADAQAAPSSPALALPAQRGV